MRLLYTSKIVIVLAATLIVSRSTAAQTSAYIPKDIPPPANKAVRVQITEGPALELFRNNEAIIRWTSDNPGGTDEHWGAVHYGTDASHLTQTAKGHIRLNRNNPYTIFRVRLPDLKPGTTYYYTVSSMNADGTSDPLKSGIYHLTTPNGA